MSASSPSPAQVRPGYPTEVAGRYRVLGKIAEGGMGVVYRAEHVLSKKRLALKLLYPHLCHGPQAIERFRREVSAAAEIDHPGIVQVFDAGVDNDGSFYMAMELLEGESLAQHMRHDWPTTHRAVDLVRQVLGPLTRAHDRGFVHRDIKPENIFLAKDASTGIVAVKLLDFGLTREVQRKGPTLTGITFGTPEYMSPEQCMSAKKAGTPSDVWSMGVLLYELLTGYHPFAGETPNAIMVSAIKDPHTPVAERAPHVPQRLAKVVERCLEKEPERRPQTAGELAELIEDALADVTLTDTKPARTHLDDEPPEDDAAPVTMDGIPIGGADTTAKLREGPPPSERGVSTEPTQSAVSGGIGWKVPAAVAAIAAVGAVGLAMYLSRIGEPVEPVSTALPVPSVRDELVDPTGLPAVPEAPIPEATEPEATEPEVVAATAPEAVERTAHEAVEAPPPEAPVAEEPAVAEVPSEATPEAAPGLEEPTGRTTRPATVAHDRSEPATELSPEQYAEATACLAHGDRACAIRILRESRRPRDLARVISLYEVEGRSREATAAMQSFVRRFPSAPETERFRTELERRGL